MNNSNEKKQKLKVSFLGDNNVGKSTIVSNYIQSSGDKNVIQKPEYKRFEKQINNTKFLLDFYEFNQRSDKYTCFITASQVVIVIFDLNNRSTFDNLSDCWFSFLRDDCKYINSLHILGNYSDPTSVPLTQVEEINQMIEFSGINAEYTEIGNKKKEEVNMLIDKIINESYENEKKNAKIKGCKADSLKVKDCIIY